MISTQNRLSSVKTVVLSLTAIALLLASLSVIVLATNGSGSAEDPAWVALHPDEYRDAVLKAKHRSDPVLALYRDPSSRDEVVAFFSAIVHSQELADIILSRAEEFDVSPSLAAALSWEESRYNPRAINRNKASIDRGLFQLNSKSFPKLTETEFYDPDVNARFGIAHLRWCLDLAGNDVAGLAMYNAGTTRVRSDTTPKKTLDYVSRILSFKAGVDSLFESEMEKRWLIAADGGIKPVAPRRSTETRLASALFPLLTGSSR